MRPDGDCPAPCPAQASTGCCFQDIVEQSMNRDIESNARACGMNAGSILNSLEENLSRSWNISRHKNACATKLLKCCPAQLKRPRQAPSSVGVLTWPGATQDTLALCSHLVLQVKAI